MPNWCNNHITVEGPKEELKRFQKLMETKYSRFDFEALLPRPKEFEGIISGHSKIDGVDCRCWRDIDGKSVPVPQEELDDLTERFGASNWYDWNVQKWGTKWNVPGDEMSVDSSSKTILQYSFDTAWSPPLPVLAEAARQFPTLSFTIHYEEPGNAFYGDAVWEDGELIFESDGEMDYDEENEEYICIGS